MSHRALLIALAVVILVVLGGLAVARIYLWPSLPGTPRFTALDLPQVRLWSRGDQTEIDGHGLRVRGDAAELWIESDEELGPVLFQFEGDLKEVRVRSGFSQESFETSSAEAPRRISLEWQPRQPRRPDERFFYHLVLLFPDAPGTEAPRVTFLGRSEVVRRELYSVEWLDCALPEGLVAGAEALALGHFGNTSPHPWPHAGPARVRLSYRWLDASGAVVPHEGSAEDLDATLEPGTELARWLAVRTPDAPGSYVLELDLFYEPMAWFSEKGAGTCRVTAEIG